MVFGLLFGFAVYFVKYDAELLDDFGGLLGELGGGPSEFFAEPKVGDGGVGFASADGADKKAASSLPTEQRRLTV
jgi:hypothetical protein